MFDQFRCGHCRNLAPAWKQAATALKGVVKVGAVDMDQHQSVGGPYNVRGFPTIKIFGANKQVPSDYNGKSSPLSLENTTSLLIPPLDIKDSGVVACFLTHF